MAHFVKNLYQLTIIYLALLWTTVYSFLGFLNGPTPASLSFNFALFMQTSLQILQQINGKKSPSSIRCRGLNPQPLEHESPPRTTRQGSYPSSAQIVYTPNETNPYQCITKISNVTFAKCILGKIPLYQAWENTQMAAK